jgi:hypothetical protein
MCITLQLASFRKLQIIKAQEVAMTAAQNPDQIRAHISIDAPWSAAVSLVGRHLEAIAYGWRFAEVCRRASRCCDDAAPAPYLSEFGLDWTSEGPFVQ